MHCYGSLTFLLSVVFKLQKKDGLFFLIDFVPKDNFKHKTGLLRTSGAICHEKDIS